MISGLPIRADRLALRHFLVSWAFHSNHGVIEHQVDSLFVDDGQMAVLTGSFQELRDKVLLFVLFRSAGWFALVVDRRRDSIDIDAQAAGPLAQFRGVLRLRKTLSDVAKVSWAPDGLQQTLSVVTLLTQ